MFDQQKFYSRHKRKHGYKYQSIVTPDGLVSSLIIPFIGRYGDGKMIELSGLEERLRKMNFGRQAGQVLYLYGDPAYSTIYGIMVPYKNYLSHPCTPAQKKFNKIMARL